MQDDISVVIHKDHLPSSLDFRAGALLLVDKEKGWTSFDVVNKIRYAIRHKLQVKKFKVGHAGTLDPMATGLLLVCIGKYTKKIDQLQGFDKSYNAVVKLGATTASYDAETDEENIHPTDSITLQKIEDILPHFRGNILQKPPIYSALKVDGVRLYKIARKGGEANIKPRPVTIHSLDINAYEEPLLNLSCSVSKGTYIRSLAHDIGQELGVGGYLTELRRTLVKDYNVTDALNVENVVSWINETRT